MKQAKESIATMIKAASSRAILLIFSSFLPAGAVGVVGYRYNAESAIGFILDVIMSVKVGSAHTWVVLRLAVNTLLRLAVNTLLWLCIYSYVLAPRQRQGKQGEKGYFDSSFHICFLSGSTKPPKAINQS